MNSLTVSENHETSPEAPTPALPMTLRDAANALRAQDVEIGYSTLSELLKTGDIAQQLGLGGAGNRREIHPDAVAVLAAFLPEFRAAGGKTPQAPAMLRGFLRQRAEGLVLAGTTDLVISETANMMSETAKPRFLESDPAHLAAVQGRAQGLAQTERVLTAREAADVLHVSVRMLRKTVKPFRRFGNSPAGDRWLLSDLLLPT